jgi:serine/threonine protein kinase
VDRHSQSDVWALGCVLYELTTLNHAFDGGNMCALVLKILRGKYPPIDERYSAELRDMVANMLNPNVRSVALVHPLAAVEPAHARRVVAVVVVSSPSFWCPHHRAVVCARHSRKSVRRCWRSCGDR